MMPRTSIFNRSKQSSKTSTSTGQVRFVHYNALETLDAKEVFIMLEQNNINIPTPCLKNLFAVVQPRNPSELRMGEFIKFSFDEKANKSKL